MHGFNVPFGNGVFRFAQMIHDSKMSARPFCFRGHRADVCSTTSAIWITPRIRDRPANFLRAASASPDVNEIVVFAHSMGSWIAVEAIRQLALETGLRPRKIKNLISLRLISMSEYFAARCWTWARAPLRSPCSSRSRTGVALVPDHRARRRAAWAVDLSADAYRDQLKQLRKVTVIDLSELRQGDRINHSLYAASPEAVRLIGRQLVEGHSLDNSDGSAGLK